MVGFLVLLSAGLILIIPGINADFKCVNESINIFKVTCNCATSGDLLCREANISNIASNFSLPNGTKSLDLSFNNLSTLRDYQFQSPDLEHLVISHNNISVISDHAFEGLENLISLDLSYNEITILGNSVFNKLSKLKRLNIRHNSVKIMEENVFDNVIHLEELLLGSNPIEEILIKNTSTLLIVMSYNLVKLDLSKVGVKRISDELFRGNNTLEILDLSGNDLDVIPFLPSSLKVLNLSAINITTIETGEFHWNIPRIKELYLNDLDNLVNVSENAFENLDHLEVLTLNNCKQLSEFNEFAFGNPYHKEEDHSDGPFIKPPLKRFSVAKGKLSSLASPLLEVLKDVEDVDLQLNPWNCNCDLAWILLLNISNETSKMLRCFDPPELTNVPIMHLSEDDFNCKKKSNSPLAIVLIVLLVIALLLGGSYIILVLVRKGKIAWFKPRRKGKEKYQPVQVESGPKQTELETWNEMWDKPAYELGDLITDLATDNDDKNKSNKSPAS